MVLLEVSILVLLFACSAFFACSEAALTALSTLKMKQLSALQPRFARLFSDWLDRPHRLLVTILVGNNAVNVAISSLSAALIVPVVRSLPEFAVEIILWLCATGLLLIFGEIVPKIIGRVYAERISLWTLPVLNALTQAFQWLFRPAHWALDRFARGVESAPVNRLTVLSLEEMQHIIRESEATGFVSGESGAMMDRVLSLHRRTAADIMQPSSRIDTVSLELLDESPPSRELFVDLVVESGRSRVPVTRAGVPVGIIHAMDLLKDWRTRSAISLNELVRPVHGVPRAQPVSDLLAHFQKTGEHVALVEGEGGSFLGLVTLEDILEEVVGEIVDEYDVEQKKR